MHLVFHRTLLLGEAKRAAMRKEFNEKSLVLAPEKAAEIIIKGIKKKKHRVLVGRDAVFIDRLVRIFPSGYTRRILKLANIGQYWE